MGFFILRERSHGKLIMLLSAHVLTSASPRGEGYGEVIHEAFELGSNHQRVLKVRLLAFKLSRLTTEMSFFFVADWIVYFLCTLKYRGERLCGASMLGAVPRRLNNRRN